MMVSDTSVSGFDPKRHLFDAKHQAHRAKSSSDDGGG